MFDAKSLDAETIHAAVLFADMRGYTGLAERLPPARVVSLLHEFFRKPAGTGARAALAAVMGVAPPWVGVSLILPLDLRSIGYFAG